MARTASQRVEDGTCERGDVAKPAGKGMWFVGSAFRACLLGIYRSAAAPLASPTSCGRARELLASRALSLADVAVFCGFFGPEPLYASLDDQHGC